MASGHQAPSSPPFATFYINLLTAFDTGLFPRVIDPVLEALIFHFVAYSPTRLRTINSWVLKPWVIIQKYLHRLICHHLLYYSLDAWDIARVLKADPQYPAPCFYALEQPSLKPPIRTARPITMSNPEDFTVGWICALPTEFVAAQLMLDDKFRVPRNLAPGDKNNYVLGRIDEHNVVIATLPLGEYGIASAATVATNIRNSFPNVRIGLMVGIGGGVPSDRHDIRLGDIVVSTPSNGQGGVFQYDFGRTIQDQAFHHTGHLDKPPVSLRTALSGIQAEYEISGHQLKISMQTALEKAPKASTLIAKYQKPPTESDKLFKPQVSHDVSCSASCSSDPSNHVRREARGSDSDDPTIHYGLIASGNQVMKDASIRNRLAAERDVLCFEMEAAGLMNHFPCLVIRGICDYADSHKADDWRGYAALAAAAFAKDLLIRIPTSRLEEERRLKDVLSEVRDMVSNMTQEVIALSSSENRQTDERILEWITPSEYGYSQSAHRRPPEVVTSNWFLESQSFQSWVETGNQTLFCPGMPGAGKTILGSVVVEHLLDRFRNQADIGIASICCDYRLQSKQSTHSLLATLLKQLSRQRSLLPAGVKDLYERHKNKRTQPTLKEIFETLQSVSGSFSRVFIVVDALDECPISNSTRSELVNYLLTLQKDRKASILATSRHIPAIEERFADSLKIEIKAKTEDVETYIDRSLHKLPEFVRSRSDLLDDIKAKITRSVQGMFLLARLHLESLVGKVNIKGLRVALSSLPSGSDAYDHAYTDAMGRIQAQSKDQKELAEKALLWLIHAKSPLTIRQLRYALAVENGERQLDPENLSSAKTIVSFCAGLVTVDEKTGIASLIHYTTQEYFKRTGSHWFPDAEVVITTTCLTYLSFRAFESSYIEDHHHLKALLIKHPLYEYAACYWGYHAEKASDLGSLIADFLSNSTLVVLAIQIFEASVDEAWYRGPRSWEIPKFGLHLAVMLKNKEMVRNLIDRGIDPDLKDGYGQTPLRLAVLMDHADIVESLLHTNRVDFDSKFVFGLHMGHSTLSKQYSATPLDFSVLGASETVSKLLLGHGACPDGKNVLNPPTPLCAAVSHGDAVRVNLLLQSGATYPIPDFGVYPLCVAGHQGSSNLVELLIERLMQNGMEGQDYRGRPGKCPDQWFRMPLSWAANYGLLTIVKKLIDDGADVDGHETGPSRMPLFLAASRNHVEVVKLLLEVRTKRKRPTLDNDSSLAIYAAQTSAIDVLDYFLKWKIGPEINDSVCGRSLLSWAAGCGVEAAVKLLLENGASITSVDKSGRTPLWWAMISGKKRNVDILQTSGATVDVSDHRGRSMLLRATQEGHQHIVQCLVDAGAYIDWKEEKCLEVLSLASKSGRHDIVECIVSTDPNLESTDKDGRTALIWAAANANAHLVTFLLRKGVNIEAVDKNCRTSLSWSAGEGHEAVVQVLLDAKADTLSQDDHGWTPLWHAMFGNHVRAAQVLSAPQYKITWTDGDGVSLLHHVVWNFRDFDERSVSKLYEKVKILVDRGLDINQKEGHRTMLIQAAESGDLDLLDVLVQLYADVELADHLGRTPSSWAACKGHLGVLNYLLENGAQVDAADNLERTPLSWGAWKGHLGTVCLLLRNGADINYPRVSGKTPLWYAILGGHVDVINFLQEAGGQVEGVMADLLFHMVNSGMLYPRPEDV